MKRMTPNAKRLKKITRETFQGAAPVVVGLGIATVVALSALLYRQLSALPFVWSAMITLAASLVGLVVILWACNSKKRKRRPTGDDELKPS